MSPVNILRRLQYMSSRRLEEVFSITIFHLPRRLEEMFQQMFAGVRLKRAFHLLTQSLNRSRLD